MKKIHHEGSVFSNASFVFQKNLTKDKMKKWNGNFKAAWCLWCVLWSHWVSHNNEELNLITWFQSPSLTLTWAQFLRLFFFIHFYHKAVCFLANFEFYWRCKHAFLAFGFWLREVYIFLLWTTFKGKVKNQQFVWIVSYYHTLSAVHPLRYLRVSKYSFLFFSLF